MKRRPVEAIQRRADYGARCELLVVDALAQLTEAGAPFTVEDVCSLAGVGKTFIYDKRRPAITRAVLRARDASQGKPALPLDKDPACCNSDKLWISVDAFDAGCLTTLGSLRSVVLRLTREAALEIIDGMIGDLERKRTSHTRADG